MRFNRSRLPTHGNRVNSLRTGDFFHAKAIGAWVSALWRSLCFCSGLTTPSGRIFHQYVTNSVGLLPSSRPSGSVQTLTGVADQVLKIEGSPK